MPRRSKIALLLLFLWIPVLSRAAELHLTWSDQSNNEDGFTVQRQLDGEPNFSTLTMLGPNIENYTDSTVPWNIEATYRVRAFNSAGNSGWSNEASGLLTLAAVGDMPPIQVLYEEISIDPALILALGFNEGAGSTTADSSGNGNDGTLNGPTWTTQGKFGSALSFDGSNDWVTIADAPSLDLTTGMTLEAWVYPTTVLSGWRGVIQKEQTGGVVYYLYANSGADQPATGVFVGGEQILQGGSRLAVNTWTHLAATYNGSQQRLYVNGVEVANRAQIGQIQVSSDALRIGGNSVWGEYFQGRIDDVRLYSRALSPVEIQTDMNTGVQ